MDHVAVLRNYIDTDTAIVELFKKNPAGVTVDAYMKVELQHVIATREYIESLKLQNFSVPAGLEEINKSDLKRHGIVN